MMNVVADITIDRPIEDVFAFVSNVENMPTWVTGVSAATLIGDQVRQGAHFTCEYTSSWRTNEIELEITQYDAPTVFGTESARGPFNFEGRLELSPVDGGTRVTNSIEAGPDSLATRLASILLGWFLRPSMRKRLRRELEALRNALGAGQPVGT